MIIPSIIYASDLKSIAIIDGNHRLALCRFLKLEKIPFLIEKKQFENFRGLE